MTDQDAPTQAFPPDPPPDPAGRPPLRRSAEDRVLTGLAGGLGRHLDVDPVLVRVGFALLALLGGLGIAAYVVLALVVPAQDGAPVAGRGGSTLGIVALVAVLGLALLVLGAGGGLFVFAPGVVALLVLAAAGVLVVRGVREEDGGARRVLLVLGILIVSAAVAVGAATAVAFGGGTVVTIVAVALGVALVVAGLLGGARWLVLPALAVALPAVLVAASGLDLRGGVGEERVRPASLASVQPDYRMGAGRLELDLRDVAFKGTTDLALSAGAGRIDVVVPPDVCVTTRGTTSAGTLQVFGRDATGFDAELRDERTARAGRPTLRLAADVTLGQVVVSHELDPRGFGHRGWAPAAQERQGACARR